MEKLALYLSWLTIAALNAIVFLAISSNGQIMGHSTSFGLLVNVMYVALISSSVLLGYLNWQKQRHIWAFLFWANILMVLIPTILTIVGFIILPPAVLIFLDLYWLNQYWLYALTNRMRTRP